MDKEIQKLKQIDSQITNLNETIKRLESELNKLKGSKNKAIGDFHFLAQSVAMDQYGDILLDRIVPNYNHKEARLAEIEKLSNNGYVRVPLTSEQIIAIAGGFPVKCDVCDADNSSKFNFCCICGEVLPGKEEFINQEDEDDN